jgi:methionyl-tRNA formyltransferase
MRVAFFGLPLAALALAGDGHDVVWAGVGRAHAAGARRLARRIGGERLHVVPDAATEPTPRAVQAAGPDLIVSWFFTKKIPPGILRLAPSFGVHPSLLPRHRGPDPYFWAIDAGDSTSGVTAHALDAEYDTGPILAQRALSLDPSWNAWRLARALDRPGLALLREVARAFAEGRPPAPRPQDERDATLAPEPTDEELALRWSWPARRIERRVRAAAPWPGAWTEIGGRIVTLLHVRPTRDFPRALAPGEAAVRADGVAVVRSGEDAVELAAGRDDEGEPLSTADLAGCVERARALSIVPGSASSFDKMT